jgi:hypothetical protein
MRVYVCLHACVRVRVCRTHQTDRMGFCRNTEREIQLVQTLATATITRHHCKDDDDDDDNDITMMMFPKMMTMTTT